MGWFSPKCPLDTYEKAWTEFRMMMLARVLGIDRLKKAEVILPEEKFFPDPYTGTPEEVRQIFDRVCGFMQINASLLNHHIEPDDKMNQALGLYIAAEKENKAEIAISDKQLGDVSLLIATIAHELSHDILIRGGYLQPNVADSEEVTDLLPVFLGMGFFAANSCVFEKNERDGALYSWWSMERRGYLPARIFGYAMALFVWLRGEDYPEWAKYLRLDVSATLKSGLKFLNSSGDSLIKPDSKFSTGSRPSSATLVDQFKAGSPSIRLTTLWDLDDANYRDPAVQEMVIAAIRDRDPVVAAQAAESCSLLQGNIPRAVGELQEALTNKHPKIRKSAIKALGSLGLNPDLIVPSLCELLEDSELDVAIMAASALRQYAKPIGEKAENQLLALIKNAVIKVQEPVSDHFADVFVRLCPSPIVRLAEYLGEEDPELLRDMKKLLIHRLQILKEEK